MKYILKEKTEHFIFDTINESKTKLSLTPREVTQLTDILKLKHISSIEAEKLGILNFKEYRHSEPHTTT